MKTNNHKNHRALRKLIGMLLCLTLMIGMLPNVGMRADNNTIYIGDVDGDGTITPKDVTIIRRYLAGGWGVNIDTSEADTDADGSVTPKDVTILRRFLAGGWGVELPIKESVLPPTEDLIASDIETPLEKGRWTIIDRSYLNDIYNGYSFAPQYSEAYQVDEKDENGLVKKSILLIGTVMDESVSWQAWTDKIERDGNGRILSETYMLSEYPTYNDFLQNQEESGYTVYSKVFYEYDDNGMLTKAICTNAERNVLWTETYDYNALGKLVKKTRKALEDYDFEPLIFDYYYNSYGALLRQEAKWSHNGTQSIVFYSDGKINKVLKSGGYNYDYVYSNEGSEISVIKSYKNNTTDQTIIKTYSDGKLLNTVYEEGEISSSGSIAFNNMGFMVEEENSTTDYKGNLIETTEKIYRQHDAEGNLVKAARENIRNGVRTNLTLIEKSGNLISEKEYREDKLREEKKYIINADGNISEIDTSYYKTVYTYDSNGNMITEQEFENGKDYPNYQYSYEYDESNRIIGYSAENIWGYSTKKSFEYDTEGYRINILAPTNVETEKDSDGRLITETETYYDGSYSFKYFYDIDGAIVKVIVTDYSGTESVFERECDTEGNIIRQPVKQYSLISSGYYAPGFLYKGEIGLVDQEGAVEKKSDGEYSFEYSTDTDGNQVVYRYRNGQKRYSDHYDAKGQHVKQVRYYYNSNDGTEMPSYEYIISYSYNEAGVIEKYTWGYSNEDGISGGVCYEADEYGFLKDYEMVLVNESQFPDENFRKYLLENYDLDGDGCFTRKELEKIEYIDVSDRGITDLTGIKLLTELKSLTCYNNPLDEVDLSYKLDNNIEVFCNNGVKVVYAIPIDEDHFPDDEFRRIIKRRCDYNYNGYLDGKELSIEKLDISDTGWDYITYDNLNGINYFWNLKVLTGDEFTVGDVDLSGCENLERISFDEFDIQSINIQACNKLQSINLFDGCLRSGVVSFGQKPELTTIDLSEVGYLREIDIKGCTNLKELKIDECYIKTLDISGCPNLEVLNLFETGVRIVDARQNPLLTPENVKGYYYDDDYEDMYNIEVIWN